jgi:hypothetical protein
MSRCKSCDNILSKSELSRYTDTGEPEDLCGGCGYIVFLDVNDLFMEYRDYQFGDVTEGGEGMVKTTPQLKVSMND